MTDGHSKMFVFWAESKERSRVDTYTTDAGISLLLALVADEKTKPGDLTVLVFKTTKLCVLDANDHMRTRKVNGGRWIILGIVVVRDFEIEN